MKQKTQELTGPTLDYFVAKALGLRCALEVHPMTVPKPTGCWLIPDGQRLPDYKAGPFAPSTNWNQGGPIIERESIGIDPWINGYGGGWTAICVAQGGLEHRQEWEAPLIAAMRAFVAAKLGDEVET